MITKESLRQMLLDGRQLTSNKYRGGCRIHHLKTFYFFCQRLHRESPNTSLSSSDLNDHILRELRHDGIQVNKQFNPQGWFGKAWTDWEDPEKNEKHFKSEYQEVLQRIGGEPYRYQIKPEYSEAMRESLAELA